jgi:uncharacterized LabA/DUF88 family protein
MTSIYVNTYAFIDGNNLHLTLENLGWKLDLKKFRVYLKEKYGVTKAYYFVGYLEENENLYAHLREYGYIVVFKEVLKIKNKETGELTIKGNVDAELVLQVMIDFVDYRQAVIISSDGDYSCLVKYLVSKKKLLTILAPCKDGCSHLLVKSSLGNIAYVDKLRNILEFKPLK